MALSSERLWNEARDKFSREEVDVDEYGKSFTTGFRKQEHDEHRLAAGVALAKLATDLRATELAIAANERVAMAQLSERMLPPGANQRVN